ncbi:gustatory receptor for sugar taste 43a-like [Homalodisca vitripennis]|uniref:gustatory receptor for sugar taste 43a-like n=1 Tax=Homalodisca vitripennis TaxID=197043 RepID=UPI001EEA2D9A|nr:gustatory receptor for sugar taste 43a-like [Homalodisca vitripennis]
MKSFPVNILRFCRIFGCLPLEYTSETGGIKALKFSYTGLLWSSTLVVLQILISITALYIYFMFRLNYQSPYRFCTITEIVISLDLVSLQVVAAVMFFSSAWKYPKLVSIFDTLEKVYQDFQLKSEIKATLKVLGICTVAVTLATTAEKIVIVFHEWVSAERTLPYVMSSIPILMLYYSHAAFLVQFTHLTQTIAKSFRMVNAKIESEITSHVNVDDTHTTCSTKIKKLRTLMNTYWMLCDAVHQANVLYCDQLMAVMYSLFLHITIKSYFFFLHVRAGKVFIAINEGASILILMCYIVLLLNSSTDVTSKADDTGPMICRMINTGLDPILRKLLEGFLLQWRHHNARFSAFGCFQIHNETLTVMAGAVTTYLVILIQFQTEASST